MSKSDVHLTLERLVDRLTQLEIPYAIVGALSLNAYGYQRTTTDVDVLVRREGLDAFKKAFLGRAPPTLIPPCFMRPEPGARRTLTATGNAAAVPEHRRTSSSTAPTAACRSS